MRTAWTDLPREESALYNPGFTGLLIARFVDGHQTQSNVNPSLPVALAAVPIALHAASRDALPRSVASNLLGWLQDNPDVTTIGALRAHALGPLLREALLFVLAQRVCSLSADGSLTLNVRLRSLELSESPDVERCQRASVFLGRWFARSGASPATLLSLLGVAP